MRRFPSGSKDPPKRTPWSAEEDFILVKYIKNNGVGAWNHVPNKTGLKRSGKSCRLRWLNYLHPDIKRGNISLEEDDLIIKMYRLLGTRWSLIAKRLPGRTDNEIKNYWNTHLSKRAAEPCSPNKSDSSSTSIEDNRISNNKPIGKEALKGPEMLISDGCDSAAHIKEKEDHNFCFNDDLHALIETQYLDEIESFESIIQLENSFESKREVHTSFAAEMLGIHDQLVSQSRLKSKLKLLRQILELEEE